MATAESPPPITLRRHRAGNVALVLAVCAVTASVVCSIVVGVGLGPLELRQQTGTPSPHDATAAAVYVALAWSNVIWTGLGVWALVLGTTAIAKNRSRGAGIAAVVIAAVGPVASFAVWVGLTLLTAPLG
ncbi:MULTISPECIES: hypothetical protein [unclassified Curtobacterium]|uniref:hypothetical protein n=1 Tax=unclassified Curtobacterium TaxID=257496 RepID=UPI0008DEA941|nr:MULTISPECIES: hypothetical protein [unclassified Curtobacterium]OIH98054.1 hypothetical protein BIU92_14775 [Curtobacterium sp. MCBA15_003]OII32825.1 hypothetical protein BIU94_16100 [Curtobacterium sp. MMLR14_006]